MAYSSMSQPDPYDPRRMNAAATSGQGRPRPDADPAASAALAQLVKTLSAHGGGDAAAGLALDLVLNDMVEHACQATSATAAAIALVRGDEIVCRATTGENAPDLGVPLNTRSGLSAACVQSRQGQLCDDSEIDARVDAELCRRMGFRSILVFPVLRESRRIEDEVLLGVVEIFSPRPKAFGDHEIRTVQGLARSIVATIDRATTVSALEVNDTPAFDSMEFSQPEPEAGFVGVPSSVTEDSQMQEPDVSHADLTQSGSQEGAAPKASSDYWTTFLNLAVIALSLILGWMVGRAGWQMTTQSRQPRSAVSSPASQPSSVVAPQPLPASSTNPPARKTGTVAVPPGGLVVYENGAVIFPSAPSDSSPQPSGDGLTPVRILPEIAEEYIQSRVEPDYPQSALDKKIQGPVVLDALVDKDGVVRRLTTVSGDPQLLVAAADAVRQWRFRPFFHDGAPEAFETQITLNFNLP